MFLLFVGTFLIIQGYYSQAAACPPPKIEVKYIPKTYYDEQLSEPTVAKQFKGMFEDVTPWPTVRG